MKDSFVGREALNYLRAVSNALDRGWSTADLRQLAQITHDTAMQAIARREQQMAERARKP